MEFPIDLAVGPYALSDLTRWDGHLALVTTVFTDTGLLVGLCPRGSLLLITAGLVAAARTASTSGI